eukprot:4428580-Amphidinium_carterae.1
MAEDVESCSLLGTSSKYDPTGLFWGSELPESLRYYFRVDCVAGCYKDGKPGTSTGPNMNSVADCFNCYRFSKGTSFVQHVRLCWRAHLPYLGCSSFIMATCNHESFVVERSGVESLRTELDLPCLSSVIVGMTQCERTCSLAITACS